MSHILHTLQSLLSAEIISAAADSTGENEQVVSQTLIGLFPVLLNGLMLSRPAKQEQLNDILNQAGNKKNFVHDLASDIRSGNSSASNVHFGIHFISGVFEQKESGISDLTSTFSGIHADSSTTLLHIGGAILAWHLGHKMQNEGLTFNGMMHWLSDQKDIITQAVPPDFSGFLNNGTNYTAPFSATASLAHQEDEPREGTKWLLPVLLVGFLGVGIWYWMKASETTVKTNGTNGQTPASIHRAADSAANTLQRIKDSIAPVKNPTIDSTQIDSMH